MTSTPNLVLPYIAAAQAQKHVTHNEAIRTLDALVQLAVIDRDLTAPPGSPAEGDRYIVATGGTGTWASHDGEIAAWQDGVWRFHVPQEGWIVYIADEDVAMAWNGSAWGSIATGASVNPTPLVGVNATADTTNRLSVSSPASLFNNEGAGHQAKINKNAATDTASFLFQTAFSGRAEMGITGDDDFHFKVSPDGTTWKDALQIDRTTGVVTMPFSSFGGGGSALPDVIIEDQKAAGTDGGTANTGVQTRTLNTLVRNEATLATLAANQFTLPAGTYRIQASAPGYLINGYKVLLYNVTDAAYVLTGSSEYAGNAAFSATRSFLDGVLITTATKTFELRQWVGTTRANNGFGRRSDINQAPAPANALSEVFAMVNIWKQ